MSVQTPETPSASHDSPAAPPPDSHGEPATKLSRLCTSFESLTDQARQAMTDNPGWLDEAVDTIEAARIVGEAPGTLAVKRCRGGGPRFGSRGRLVYYRRRDLFDYLAQGIRANTSDPGPKVAA